MENKKYDVYISYCRADLEFVKRLEGELDLNGITCWVDYKDIGYGEVFADQIASAIKNIVEDAKIFICIISPSMREGSHMEKDISLACRYGAKYILPVYLDDVKPSEYLEYLLSPYNSIHLSKESELSSLIDTVLTMLGKNAWVFVSHSNKDFNKIIRLRNKLEARYYKPLLFFLKCLDDDKEIFELIKREIRARDRFILCNSTNSRNSKWVQREIEYIKSLDRPYEIIDIESTDAEIDAAINRFDHRSTVYIWSTDTSFNHIVAYELMKKSFRVTLLPMDYYQKFTKEQQLSDGYCLLLISRKLTDAETSAISVYAKNACDYTYPVVISEEAFANWELFRELQNLDGIKTMTYLLNSEKKSEAIRSFESDQDRALALVKHFIELDNHVNNKV